MAAFCFLAVLTVLCLLAPPILEQTLHVDPNRTDILHRYQEPGEGEHLLGTDPLGRDQLSRLLYGGRISLLIASTASAISIGIGVTLGLLAGYYSGPFDDFINWLVNTLYSIPTIFLLILASTVLAPSPATLIVLLGLLDWVGSCRLIRGETFALKEREYVLAARAMGASDRRILFAHLLPNLISLMITALTAGAGDLILAESGLSFLGLGVQQPTPSWGNMLTIARMSFTSNLYLVIYPGLLITLTVLCFYVLGDGLRDAFDPYMARSRSLTARSMGINRDRTDDRGEG